ncbi:MAG: GxxExxY protein [Bacteroidaceae bacterium]|nr:GxxExxY protein [Bacteroidaceae bacterium]
MTRQEYMDMYDAVGVAMEVYNTLGRCLDEHIYQEAFAIEANMRGMDIEREKKLSLAYKGIELQKVFFADFYYKGIIIEFKSVEELASVHRAQLLNYMRISNQDRGILFNFGETNLHSERYLYLPEEDDFVLLTHENYRFYITN